jgi:hypothetical protein
MVCLIKLPVTDKNVIVCIGISVFFLIKNMRLKKEHERVQSEAHLPVVPTDMNYQNRLF